MQSHPRYYDLTASGQLAKDRKPPKRGRAGKAPRTSYTHVGRPLPDNLRMLDEAERARFAQAGFVAHEDLGGGNGRYWSQRQIDFARQGWGGCGTVTVLHAEMAAAHARGERAYAWCACCGKDQPVGEFVWEGTDERLGR